MVVITPAVRSDRVRSYPNIPDISWSLLLFRLRWPLFDHVQTFLRSILLLPSTYLSSRFSVRVATRNMCACHLLPANPLTAMYARRTHGLLCAQRVRLSRVFLVAAWPRVVRAFLVAAGVCAPGRSS